MIRYANDIYCQIETEQTYSYKRKLKTIGINVIDSNGWAISYQNPDGTYSFIDTTLPKKQESKKYRRLMLLNNFILGKKVVNDPYKIDSHVDVFTRGNPIDRFSRSKYSNVLQSVFVSGNPYLINNIGRIDVATEILVIRRFNALNKLAIVNKHGKMEVFNVPTACQPEIVKRVMNEYYILGSLDSVTAWGMERMQLDELLVVDGELNKIV